MAETSFLTRIPVSRPFHFEDVVFSHGWLYLPPYSWDPERHELSRVERFPSGRPGRIQFTEAAGGIAVHVVASSEDRASPATREWLERLARWVFALDDDLAGFHALAVTDPGLRRTAERGQGRILRCPTVWEEVVKTLFSVNTTWRQTVAMTQHLVRLYGEPLADQPPSAESPHAGRAFPAPEVIAAVDPAELQRECRVGYRAAPLSAIAREISAGRLDLETLKDRSLSDGEVEQRLRALPGIGPYAAGNVLMLLGRHDHLPVDSWFRKTVREGWFGGREVPEREMVAAFERFRPHRTLAYLFYDWKGMAEAAGGGGEIGGRRSPDGECGESAGNAPD